MRICAYGPRRVVFSFLGRGHVAGGHGMRPAPPLVGAPPPFFRQTCHGDFAAMAATTTPPTAPAPLEEEETAEELSLAECAASMDTKAKREAISKGFFPNTGYNYDRCVAGAGDARSFPPARRRALHN